MEKLKKGNSEKEESEKDNSEKDNSEKDKSDNRQFWNGPGRSTGSCQPGLVNQVWSTKSGQPGLIQKQTWGG